MIPALRVACAALLVAGLAVLTGCGSAPSRSGGGPAVQPRPGPAASGDRDGPEANPPADLGSVPDAEPKIEPIRSGGPNKPYEVQGRDYKPITEDRPFSERGLASWYGKKFHGRRTASGEIYNMYAMTAAHPTLPIPSYVRVRNPANDREVVVRINDRGPFHPGRIVDLSYTAAFKLGVLRGVAPVELTRITFDEIRTGAWRKGPASPGAPMQDSAMVAAVSRRSAGAAEQDAAAPVSTPSRVTAPVVPPSLVPPSVVATPSVAVAQPSSPAPVVAVPPAATMPDPVVAMSAAPPASEATPTATPASPAPTAADTALSTRPAPGFWVQLGAFRQRNGAEGFHRKVAADLDWLAPLLAIFNESSAYRLQAGPYASRDEAQGVARRVRESIQLVPVIVERR
ncbi:septal ring lytic transglycosylase RlpA family protein [Piscinibacter terrae]|nr:septal ring lytic transglycosylase RlpA family protein [Albitalea terrae]